MTYKYEFPSFDYELPNLGKGWEDNSWHNDACPSLDYHLEGEEIVRIWFDYENPEMRECKGGKFVLCKGIYGESLDPLLETNKFSEILDYIKAHNLAEVK